VQTGAHFDLNRPIDPSQTCPRGPGYLRFFMGALLASIIRLDALETMRLNRFTLSFSGPLKILEKPFLESYFHKYIYQTRMLHLVTIFFYGSAGVIDSFLFPQLAWTFWIIRLLVCTVFLAGYGFSFTPAFARLWQPIFGFYIVLAGLSFIAMIIIAPPPANFSYYAGIIVCMIFGYSLIRARFIISFCACWFIFFSFEFASLKIIQTPPTVLITHSFYLAIVSLLGTLVAHLMEYTERKDFYQAFRLEQKNEELVGEIAKRRQIEEQLAASLRQKEIYLKEIHHRIKNNLQVVSSLLDMTRFRMDNPKVQKALLGARAKIQAMSFIHDQLYKDNTIDQIDMEKQIRALFTNLSLVYSQPRPIALKIQAAGIRIPLAQAMPCALVLNELISNALEHAFIGRTQGAIDIEMALPDEDLIYLKVGDDGLGLPPALDINLTDSLGLKLVRILVLKQLRGQFSVERENGTRFFIRFEKAHPSA
jgi:two-component sensor histidine kinase